MFSIIIILFLHFIADMSNNLWILMFMNSFCM